MERRCDAMKRSFDCKTRYALRPAPVRPGPQLRWPCRAARAPRGRGGGGGTPESVRAEWRAGAAEMQHRTGYSCLCVLSACSFFISVISFLLLVPEKSHSVLKTSAIIGCFPQPLLLFLHLSLLSRHAKSDLRRIRKKYGVGGVGDDKPGGR